MHTPQIIMIILLAIQGTVFLLKHGEPKDSRYSFPAWIVSTAIYVSLLYWGGFFG